MYVKCIIPDEMGVLEKDQIYTVKFVTSKGNYHLNEVDVPEPYTSFEKYRFEEIDLDSVCIKSLFEVEIAPEYLGYSSN